jgi:hypothetical protein
LLQPPLLSQWQQQNRPYAAIGKGVWLRHLSESRIPEPCLPDPSGAGGRLDKQHCARVVPVRCQHSRRMLGSFGSESAFYEVAATLIPLFLLGGIVLERLKPQPDDSPRWVLFMTGAIPSIGVWAIFSEAVAISVIVTGTSNLLTRLVVASALSAGMLAVVISLWLPWLRRFASEWTKGMSSNTHWWIGFAIIFVLTTFLMERAVSSQGSEEFANSTIEELNRVNREALNAENRIASLSVERARSEREFTLAMGLDAECLDARAFLKELDQISWVLNREGHQLDRAILEGVKLNLQLQGDHSKPKLPFRATPEYKRGPDLIPLKRCLKQVRHEN